MLPARILLALCVFASFPIHAQTALQIVNIVISDSEDGPPLPPSQKLVPGETAFVRFDVAGFKTSDEGRVQLTGRVQVSDSRRSPIAPRDEIVIGTSLRDEDKNWKPRMRSQVQIPPIAPPGAYRVRCEVTDEQTHSIIAADGAFTVSGIDVPVSNTLVIRHLAFYRTADEEAPLKIPAYRPGDAVWVRFEITGYKYGEQNAIDVAYDVSASNAQGKQLFAQENAANEKSQAFYPQPWVPGSFSLTLQPNTTPGMYSVTIASRDAVGNQTATERAQFKVE